MRIALLTTGLATGGAEMQLAALARLLRAAGNDVSVVSLSGPAALAAELEADGIAPSSIDLKSRPHRIAHLLPLFRKLRPQVVHAHLFHANLTARVLRLVCPFPVVVSTIHSLAESSRRSGAVALRDRVYRATDFLSDATVCVSLAAAERHVRAKAVSPARLRVIPNGVDTARFQPSTECRRTARAALGLGAEFTWLAAGRLMWKKNYELMLQAFARHPAGVLLIAGEGPEEQTLRDMAESLHLDVRFLGVRADMPALMNAADAFLLTSDVEGLPMVLLEAAASGLPAIATAVGGVPEAVVHERTGYIVPPGDAAAFAAAMARLAAQPSTECARMRCDAREFALRNFDIRCVVHRWIDLYRELLERGPWT